MTSCRNYLFFLLSKSHWKTNQPSGLHTPFLCCYLSSALFEKFAAAVMEYLPATTSSPSTTASWCPSNIRTLNHLPSFPATNRNATRVIANTAHCWLETCQQCSLYGDAGTGKSSTVKAIANEFASEGQCLIEVKKLNCNRSDIVERLSLNPLKFILFIDDLSFSSNDNDFSALKAILEGSVSSRGKNLAIYATSNRRHLIRKVLPIDGDDSSGRYHAGNCSAYLHDLASPLPSRALDKTLVPTHRRKSCCAV